MKSIALSNVLSLNAEVGVSKDNVLHVSVVLIIGEVADTLLVEDEMAIDTTNIIQVEPSYTCVPMMVSILRDLILLLQDLFTLLI